MRPVLPIASLSIILAATRGLSIINGASSNHLLWTLTPPKTTSSRQGSSFCRFDFQAARYDANCDDDHNDCRKWRVRIAPEAQAIFRRRRHQPRRPPLAKIRPGRPVMPSCGRPKAKACWWSRASTLNSSSILVGGLGHELTAASRQGEKNTASCYKTRHPAPTIGPGTAAVETEVSSSSPVTA